MKLDLQGAAFALKQGVENTPYAMKLGWAQQCVAAAMGYPTLAALQASGDLVSYYPVHHLVVDDARLAERGLELGIACSGEELRLRVVRALRNNLAGILVHDSRRAFEDVILALADRLFVPRDGAYTGFNVKDLDLSTNLDLAEAAQPGDSARGGVWGTLTMEPRPGVPASIEELEVLCTSGHPLLESDGLSGNDGVHQGN